MYATISYVHEPTEQPGKSKAADMPNYYVPYVRVLISTRLRREVMRLLREGTSKIVVNRLLDYEHTREYSISHDVRFIWYALPLLGRMGRSAQRAVSFRR